MIEDGDLISYAGCLKAAEEEIARRKADEAQRAVDDAERARLRAIREVQVNEENDLIREGLIELSWRDDLSNMEQQALQAAFKRIFNKELHEVRVPVQIVATPASDDTSIPIEDEEWSFT
jgi:hypothetical protein